MRVQQYREDSTKPSICFLDDGTSSCSSSSIELDNNEFILEVGKRLSLSEENISNLIGFSAVSEFDLDNDRSYIYDT